MLVMIQTMPCECFYAVRQGLFEELVWSGIVRPVGYLAERCTRSVAQCSNKEQHTSVGLSVVLAVAFIRELRQQYEKMTSHV